MKQAGLASEATSLIDKAAALLTAASKLEDAYKLYAPEDRVKEDKNAYKSHSYTTVAFDKVDEIPAVKRHSIQLDGTTIWLTAKAGHLIAYAQKDKINPEAKRDPQAAVFYMSYTRDDLPKDRRPVMFFFNDGPGEASIWMHLGAFAPKKIKLDQPTLPPNAATQRYLDFPFVDNADSLVDKADLVFVDPIGDGYTRDDLPKENRPVTFFFNGGPGSASVWLHLGSWAPKRLKTGIPNIPKEFFAAKPQSMPWLDNEENAARKNRSRLSRSGRDRAFYSDCSLQE